MARLMIEIGGVLQELGCSDESMVACVLGVVGETDPAKAIESVPATLRWLQGSMEAAGVSSAKAIQREAANKMVDMKVEIARLRGRASVTINGAVAFPEAATELEALLAEAAL